MDPEMGEMEPDVDDGVPNTNQHDVNDLFGFVNQGRDTPVKTEMPKNTFLGSSTELSFYFQQPMQTPSGWAMPQTPGLFPPTTPGLGIGSSTFFNGLTPSSVFGQSAPPLFASTMGMTGMGQISGSISPPGANGNSMHNPIPSSSSTSLDTSFGTASSQPSPLLSSSSNSTQGPLLSHLGQTHTSQLLMPQSQPAQQTAQQILGTIYTLMTEQDDKLRKLCQEQQALLQNPQIEPFNAMVTQQRVLKEQMDIELRALSELNQKVILDPPDLARMHLLNTELQVQMRQLELYHAELQQLLGQAPALPCIAALVIKKQPFPVVISKGKQLSEEQLTVNLLTGAQPNFQLVSAVRATLICDTHNPSNSKTGAPVNPLEMDSQPASLQHKITAFPLKFLQGTRKASVNIKFGVSVRGPSGQQTTIESNTSNPFVVITNECQWEGSAGTLLKKDAFGGSLEIPWPQFVNSLQRHFLLATKQDPVRPKRPLSVYDFQYINTQFFGSRSIIHQKDYDAFWNWFGKSMQTLRYQRHICTLWQCGIIYGYMGRDDVNAALNNQEPGTFIIRFSERNPGQFGIAYTGTELPTRIKHYLVQPNDTAAAKKTFPDFLSECAQFVYLLQLTHDPVTGRPLFTKSHKDIALEPYATRKAHSLPVGGYEPLST
eukprot:TRINITY_DN7779_c0_g1_i1.p1 TRINITY_DN7779_c0_g1~~TRINITY_DN7779_c0_g1_i1.p1  ORF type:complete len:658 (-),score=121.45 TRINITY_DN7779_c0_g1_i1:165-2138(-)